MNLKTRTFYIVGKNLGDAFDYFNQFLVKGVQGDNFSCLYIPSIVQRNSMWMSVTFSLTKKQLGVDVTQFMDGARNVTVTNPHSTATDWMYSYLDILTRNMTRLDDRDPISEQAVWEEE